MLVPEAERLVSSRMAWGATRLTVEETQTVRRLAGSALAGKRAGWHSQVEQGEEGDEADIHLPQQALGSLGVVASMAGLLVDILDLLFGGFLLQDAVAGDGLV